MPTPDASWTAWATAAFEQRALGLDAIALLMFSLVVIGFVVALLLAGVLVTSGLRR